MGGPSQTTNSAQNTAQNSATNAASSMNYGSNTGTTTGQNTATTQTYAPSALAQGYLAAGTTPATQNISQYYNPYQQQVINSTMGQLGTQFGQQQTALVGNASANNALGGNRQGVAQAQLAGLQGQTAASTLAGLESQGYTQALTAAQAANAQNLQAAGMAGGTTVGQGQMLGSTLGSTSGTGNTAQSSASAQAGTGQGTSTTTMDPGMMGYLGAGIMGLGLLSDERVKENIHPIGKTFDGQTIHKFNYTGNPTTHIGLLAQEVEKRHPEAVGSLGHLKTVNYDSATKDAERANGGALRFDSGGAANDGGLSQMMAYLNAQKINPPAPLNIQLPQAPAMKAPVNNFAQDYKAGQQANKGLSNLSGGLFGTSSPTTTGAGGWNTGTQTSGAIGSGGFGASVGDLGSSIGDSFSGLFRHGGAAHYASGGGTGPSLAMPSISMPNISAPAVSAPNVSMASMPSVTMPTVPFPSVPGNANQFSSGKGSGGAVRSFAAGGTARPFDDGGDTTTPVYDAVTGDPNPLAGAVPYPAPVADTPSPAPAPSSWGPGLPAYDALHWMGLTGNNPAKEVPAQPIPGIATAGLGNNLSPPVMPGVNPEPSLRTPLGDIPSAQEGLGAIRNYTPPAGGLADLPTTLKPEIYNPDGTLRSPPASATPEQAPPPVTPATQEFPENLNPRQTVVKATVDTWRAAGMSDNGVRGVLANQQDESRFDPTLRHPDQPRFGGEAHYAHGLFQEGGGEWNNYAKWLQNNHPGADWRDPTLQNQFTAWNLKTNYPGTWERMNAAKTPEEAAQIFLHEYEKPAAQYAAERHDRYGKGVPEIGDFVKGANGAFAPAGPGGAGASAQTGPAAAPAGNAASRGIGALMALPQSLLGGLTSGAQNANNAAFGPSAPGSTGLSDLGSRLIGGLTSIPQGVLGGLSEGLQGLVSKGFGALGGDQTQHPPHDPKDQANTGLLQRVFGINFNPLNLTPQERTALMRAGAAMMQTGNLGAGVNAGLNSQQADAQAQRQAHLDAMKLQAEYAKLSQPHVIGQRMEPGPNGTSHLVDDYGSFDWATGTWVPTAKPAGAAAPTAPTGIDAVPFDAKGDDFVAQAKKNGVSAADLDEATRVAHYDTDINKLYGIKSDRRAYIDRLAARINPEYRPENYTAAAKSTVALAAGDTRKAVNSVGRLFDEIEVASDAATKTGNSKYETANQIAGAVYPSGSEYGIARARLKTSLNNVTDTAAAVAKGGGQGAEGDAKRRGESMNGDMATPALQGALKIEAEIGLKNGQSNLTAFNQSHGYTPDNPKYRTILDHMTPSQQKKAVAMLGAGKIEEITGKPLPAGLRAPDAKNAGTQAETPPVPTATGANGEKYILKGNKWVIQ
jgi:Phage tail lysozyme/Chaperone of endosialidase